jgi:Skp family chaperone for outer membrane proteins
MKNLCKVAFLVMLSAIATPSISNPTKASVNPNAATPDVAEIKKMEQRLEEIKAMDLKSMSRPERKAIKQEVKAIKKKMDSSGGIYISVGAVILIIILLIILL